MVGASWMGMKEPVASPCGSNPDMKQSNLHPPASRRRQVPRQYGTAPCAALAVPALQGGIRGGDRGGKTPAMADGGAACPGGRFERQPAGGGGCVSRGVFLVLRRHLPGAGHDRRGDAGDAVLQGLERGQDLVGADAGADPPAVDGRGFPCVGLLAAAWSVLVHQGDGG